MESSAKIMVISGDKMITKFMQCADVFEESKVIGNLHILNISYKKNEKVTLQRAGKLIDEIKKGLEEKEIVSFIHVMEVTNGNVTIKNRGEVLPFINKNVRVISDGHNWFMFHKFIESHTELKVITNQYMFITGVGFNDGFETVSLKIKK